MDKIIDKLIDTRWFMKAVALILALLLFDSVYDPNKEVSEVNVPGEEDTEVITDVPVRGYYDTENLVVTGIPETVSVTIKGPINLLQPAKAQRDFEVYVDLSAAEIGSERVPIEIRNISDRLEVTIEPGFADVVIQEKVTKEFNVEAEFDQGLLGEGFVSEAPVIEPNTVKITGSKDVIEKISFVRATMNIRGPITDTVNEKASIIVLDREMNKLNVIVEPAAIEVTVPVKRLSKTVPINILQQGTPQNGITINSISLDVNEATITGKDEVLKETENVRVEVDVSKINEDTELTLPVIISEGITEVDPKTVKVKVDVTVNESDTEQEEEQAQETEANETLSDLPITFTGLSEQYDAAFMEPSSGRASLTVTGNSERVQQLKSSDFKLFLDLTDLGEGEHEVEINVNGPSDVSWKLATDTAKISITPKDV